MYPQEQRDEELNQTEMTFGEAELEETPSEQVSTEPSAEVSSSKPETTHLTDQEEIILTINPADLPSGHISIRQLTHIAGGLQDLADSTANTIYNQPSEKGRIPEDILESTRMILSDIQPDSFRAVLTIKHPEQTSLEQPDIVDTLRKLFSLLDVSNNNEQLARKIAALGPRTFRVYADLTKSIAELDTPVNIEWYSAYNSTSSASFDPGQAKKIYEVLHSFSDTNEDITVKGTFIGANIRTGSFELITEEGSQISGHISKNAASDLMALTFNHTYIVELLKISISGPNIQDKISWTLKDIKPV